MVRSIRCINYLCRLAISTSCINWLDQLYRLGRSTGQINWLDQLVVLNGDIKLSKFTVLDHWGGSVRSTDQPVLASVSKPLQRELTKLIYKKTVFLILFMRLLYWQESSNENRFELIIPALYFRAISLNPPRIQSEFSETSRGWHVYMMSQIELIIELIVSTHMVANKLLLKCARPLRRPLELNGRLVAFRRKKHLSQWKESGRKARFCGFHSKTFAD